MFWIILFDFRLILHALETGYIRKRFHMMQATWSKTATGGVLLKKVFLKISQNSQEDTCARVSFLIKLQVKGLWHRYFPMNFAKFLRTPFSQNISGRLLLNFTIGPKDTTIDAQRKYFCYDNFRIYVLTILCLTKNKLTMN